MHIPPLAQPARIVALPMRARRRFAAWTGALVIASWASLATAQITRIVEVQPPDLASVGARTGAPQPLQAGTRTPSPAAHHRPGPQARPLPVQTSEFPRRAPHSPAPPGSSPAASAGTASPLAAPAPANFPPQPTASPDAAEPQAVAPGLDAALPLPPRSPSEESAGTPWGDSLVTTAGSLVVVIGLLLVFAWFSRKQIGSARAGQGSVQLLEQTTLGGRLPLYVVRFSNRVLLVCQTTGGCQTLCEITEESEVQRVIERCQAAPSSGLRQVLAPLAASGTDVLWEGRDPRGSRGQGPPQPRGGQSSYVGEA